MPPQSFDGGEGGESEAAPRGKACGRARLLVEIFADENFDRKSDVAFPAGPPHGDIIVDGRHLFEIGVRGKKFDQIAEIPNSYVVNDDVETGIGNKIPLWLFGFLY